MLFYSSMRKNLDRIMSNYGGDGVLLTNFKKPLIEAFPRH